MNQCPHQNLNVYAEVVDQYVRVCFQSISVVLSSDDIALASFTFCHLTSSLLNPKKTSTDCSVSVLVTPKNVFELESVFL